MTNLVTGGSGFIGSHIVEALLRRGERVRILDIREPADPPRGIEHLSGSVTDPSAVEAAMKGVEAVFHTAANAHLWAPDKRVFEELNVGGTRIVLEAAERAKVARFVHTSSATVLVGRKRMPALVDESRQLGEADMAGPYPLSKLRAENEVRRAAVRGLHATLVLPTVPIGASDIGMTAPTRMIADFVRGRTPAFVECVLNLIDVRDVAEGHVLARDKGRLGERYILGHRNMTLSALLALLETTTGIAMPTRRVPYGLAVAAALVSEAWADWVSHAAPKASLTGIRLIGSPIALSSAKAVRELGLPQSSIETALSSAVAWLVERGIVDPPPAFQSRF